MASRARASAAGWLDGTEKAGLALFPRRSAWDKGPLVLLQYREKIDRLRLMCCHYVNLTEGDTWESCEYCLSPYSQGPAEADAPYRAWLKEQGKAATVEATLNGLDIVLDENSGVVLRLSHAAAGTILDTTPEAAGVVDVIQPGEKPDVPVTIAARASKGVKIAKTADALTVRWDQLGDRSAGGPVAATVTFKAAPDGRSTILSCSIDNRSTRPITQVLFPGPAGIGADPRRGADRGPHGRVRNAAIYRAPGLAARAAGGQSGRDGAG